MTLRSTRSLNFTDTMPTFIDFLKCLSFLLTTMTHGLSYVLALAVSPSCLLPYVALCVCLTSSVNRLWAPLHTKRCFWLLSATLRIGYGVLVETQKFFNRDCTNKCKNLIYLTAEHRTEHFNI